MIEKFVSGAKVLEFDATSDWGLRLFYRDNTTEVNIASRYEPFDDEANVKMFDLKTRQRIYDYIIAEQQWDEDSAGIPDRIVIIPKEEAHG